NNSADPNENDGRLYEFSLPNRPTGNQAPNVSAGFDQITYDSVNAVLNGTVTDEGPFTSVWTQLSGPGTVTFGDANKVDTTASFPEAGVYELRLKATDTQPLTSSDKVEITVQHGLPFTKIHVSAAAGGTAINSNPSACDGAASLSYADEDILAYDPQSQCWSMYFDGSDVGLGGDGVDVDAFYRMADGSILLSLTTDGVVIPDNVGAIDDSDIVRFIPTSTGSDTAGTYAWYLDGSDAGLISGTQDIDAIGFTPNKNLVVSTTGNSTVTGVSDVKDEDLLIFYAASLGASTSGTWGLYFDGSDVGLSQNSSEDVNGTWIDRNGDIFLTTLGNFSVPDASGGGDDIFRCIQGSAGSTTVCRYDFTWDGIGNGLPAGTVLDGIALTHTPPGADTIPPKINITAPADGAAVSGTAVTVSADASDNEDLESVQFELDGANLGSLDTTAPYSISWDTTTTANGIHTLTAVAGDEAGNKARSSPVAVTVSNPIDIRVSGNSDDAEERTDTHAVNLSSPDLELTLDTVNQIVGMRFNAVAIPKGAIIKNAYIQFNADETGSAATALQIFGQAADDPSTFTSATGDISSRAKTAASVAWSPAAWPAVGDAGIDQRTPDLRAVIQEIVDRSGWTSGNSLALIISGDGNRVAEAFDGVPSAAPLLHVEYD
ncbi:MAG: Ig-like domain-containing protein, partial [Methylobacter sp.]